VRTSSILGLSSCFLVLACEVSQDFGPPRSEAEGAGGGTSTTGAGGSGGGGGDDIAQPPAPASEFEWLNPEPHGNGFRAIAATSDANVWLGGRGEVLSWNGQTWNTHAPMPGDVLYHALWTRGTHDVWVGGTEVRWADELGGALLHFDGSKWTRDMEFADRSITVLAGTAGRGYLALDGGEIRVLEGGDWKLDAVFPGREVRALFAVSDDDAWAVGDAGFIARRSASGWSVAGAALAGNGAPFGADRYYLGVWASAPTDAWAAFETLCVDDTDTCVPNEIGFAHWDGDTWSVTQQAPADCASSVAGVEPSAGGSAFDAHVTAETRRGALMAGRSATDIVASVGNGRCLWHYDGDAFSPIVQGYAVADYSSLPPLFRLHFPLGPAPAIATTPSSTFIAGSGGQLVSYDATKGFPVPQELPPWPAWETDLSPALKQAFEAERSPIAHIAIAGDEAVAIFANRPSSWTASGWEPLLGPTGSLDPQLLFSPPNPVKPFSLLHPDGSGTALWVFGRNGSELVAGSWDGVSWKAAPVEPLEADNIYLGAMDAWSAPGSSSVWLCSGNELRRYDGETFVDVALPIPPDHPTVWTIGGIGGTSESDVWVGATVDVAKSSADSDPRRLLFHYDGHDFELVHSAAVNQFYVYDGPHIRAFAPDRVLVIERHPHQHAPSDPTGMVWDGSSFSELPLPLTDAEVEGVWGRAADDVYLLGHRTEGSYLFHYDGLGWEQIFAADDLTSLAGNETSLWLGGAYGATVRAPLPPMTPPR
jgi:hypothetical protein